jgi:hypothetical protein
VFFKAPEGRFSDPEKARFEARFWPLHRRVIESLTGVLRAGRESFVFCARSVPGGFDDAASAHGDPSSSRAAEGF